MIGQPLLQLIREKDSSAFEEAICLCTKLRQKIISCNVINDTFSYDFAKNMEMFK